MRFVKSFDLLSKEMEEDFFFGFGRTCFDSGYPFGLFAGEMGLRHIEFDDITLFSGSNGSGKSTLLNIMAEKFSLTRGSAFNKTYFFDPYCARCDYEVEHGVGDGWAECSRIISSDEVFDHILRVRDKNSVLASARERVFDEKSRMLGLGGNYDGDRPRDVNIEDGESVKAFSDYVDMTRLSASQYVRRVIGLEERTFSNGENGFKYFVEKIRPGGLYLLDEPENSLSAEMQVELVHFLHGMAAGYGCQFVISTHSPFLLSLQGARIYNLDARPVTTCRWDEIPDVKVYRDFFVSKEIQRER